MSDRKFYSKVEMNLKKRSSNTPDTKISLEYYLLESIYEDENENRKAKTFGVQIVKKEYSKGYITNIEEQNAKHLSLDKVRIEKLLEDLSKNEVTPFGLYSVLDDLIGVEI
jgi:hypothetical protein